MTSYERFALSTRSSTAPPRNTPPSRRQAADPEQTGGGVTTRDQAGEHMGETGRSPDFFSDRAWLASFHAGDRATIEACYRQHFATVERAIGSLLGQADRETVIHELFSQLLAAPELRRSFQGGTLVGWLTTVARNRAIDFARRLGREVSGGGGSCDATRARTESWADDADARLLVERFRRECLPPEWQGVFELRFLQSLAQREAAQRLSLHRTTLAYRELRIRRLLRNFLLG